MMSPCRVMVTGASGFVGKRLCQALTAGGMQLTAVVRREVTEPLAGEILLTDLLDAERVTSAMHGIDCVVHLAGRAHMLDDRAEDPLAAFRQANVETTLAVAAAAIAAGVKRFVFVSSIGVNGSQTAAAAFSEHSTPSPAADYAVSKLEAEQALQALLAGSSTELVIVRPPLIYDASAPGNFARLLKLVDKGLPLPFAVSSNRRSMISLNNLISFLMLVISHDKAAGQLFVIADGASFSTRQIVDLIAQGMGRKARFFYVPQTAVRLLLSALGRQGMYIQLYCSLEVNVARARELLGWKPVEDPSSALMAAGREYRLQHSADA